MKLTRRAGAAVLNKIVKQVAEEVVLWPRAEDLIGQFPAVAGMKVDHGPASPENR